MIDLVNSYLNTEELLVQKELCKVLIKEANQHNIDYICELIYNHAASTDLDLALFLAEVHTQKSEIDLATLCQGYLTQLNDKDAIEELEIIIKES